MASHESTMDGDSSAISEKPKLSTTDDDEHQVVDTKPLLSIMKELEGLKEAKQLHPNKPPLSFDYVKDLERRLEQAKPQFDPHKLIEVAMEEDRLWEEAVFLFNAIRPPLSTTDTVEWLEREEEREFWFSKNMSEEDEHEAKLGIQLLSQQPGEPKRLGWLLTFSTGLWKDPVSNEDYSCVDLYFLSQDGSMFKCKYRYHPYFYLKVKKGTEQEVLSDIRQRNKGDIVDVELVQKDSLHLGQRLPRSHISFVKISFQTNKQLIEARQELWDIIAKRIHEDDDNVFVDPRFLRRDGVPQRLISIAEHGIPYYARFAIDNDIRCGQWYDVSTSTTPIKRADLSQPVDVRVCALHIEIERTRNGRPDGPILMISYMVDGKGYLLVNKESVGEDIEDIGYSPKLGLEGYFKVTNVENEVELLRKWFIHMRNVKPHIYVTYNGDKFDWPFLKCRAEIHGVKVYDEIGIVSEEEDWGTRGYRAKFACHIDCFAWLRPYGYGYKKCETSTAKLRFYISYSRDKYLSIDTSNYRTFFVVCRLQFNYPEDKACFDKELRQWIADHSVSDVVATYFMYQTCIRPFIFSLAANVPMPLDEIVRGRTPTMCKMFFRTEANKAGFVMINAFDTDGSYYCRYQLVDVVQDDPKPLIVGPRIVEGTLGQCLWKLEKGERVIATAARLYNQMRLENRDHVREVVDEAVKVITSNEGKSSYADNNYLDLSWMFSKEEQEDSLPFGYPNSWSQNADLQSWSRRAISNLRSRIQWIFKDTDVRFPMALEKS